MSRSKKKIDPVLEFAVRGAAAAGKTTPEIMAQTGLTEQAIQRIAREHGLTIKKSTSRITDKQRAQITAMHKEGKTRREIAIAVGCSTRSVSTYINDQQADNEPPKADIEEKAPEKGRGFAALAAAITSLAAAINLLANTGREAIIKVRADDDGLPVPKGTTITIAKREQPTTKGQEENK